MDFPARPAIYSGSLPVPKVNAAPLVAIEAPSPSVLAAYANHDQPRQKAADVLQLSEDPARRFRLKVVDVDNYQQYFAADNRSAISPPKRIQTPEAEPDAKDLEDEGATQERKLRELKKRHGLHVPPAPTRRPVTPLWKKYLGALSRGDDQLTLEVREKMAYQGPFPIELNLQVVLLPPTPSSSSTSKQDVASEETEQQEDEKDGDDEEKIQILQSEDVSSLGVADEKVSCKSFSQFGHQERREAESWVTHEPRPSTSSGRIQLNEPDGSAEDSDADKHRGSEDKIDDESTRIAALGKVVDTLEKDAAPSLKGVYQHIWQAIKSGKLKERQAESVEELTGLSEEMQRDLRKASKDLTEDEIAAELQQLREEFEETEVNPTAEPGLGSDSADEAGKADD
eukprot:GEMP01027888.1.p1 GENE.GEMP01027888.1~~GEMP01027888.1.p1  ORF type:complete len:422 (+),score=102.13 GEMP01027888.1:74-1267(+)